MEKSFTAPFWSLILLGIVAIGMSIYTLHELSLLRWGYPVGTRYQILSFCWPAVIFFEAFVYWIVRKRNRYRRASWTHIVLFALAFFSPFLKELSFEFYDSYSPGPDIVTFVRGVTLAQTSFFWGCMIVGHAYFGWLLVKCYTEGPPAEDQGADSINILDDVLS